MTKDQKHALNEIKNALTRSGGNAKQAESLIREQIKKDPTLLFGLTEPYLGGILTHAIQRAAKGMPISDVPDTSEKTKPLPKTPLSKIRPTKPKPISRGGMDGLVKALAGNVGKDGKQEKKKPSQAHVDAIKQMAKFTIKKKP